MPPAPPSQLAPALDTSAVVTSEEVAPPGTPVAADKVAAQSMRAVPGVSEDGNKASASDRGGINASDGHVVDQGAVGHASVRGSGGAPDVVGEENISTPGGSSYGSGTVEVMRDGFAAWLSRGKKAGSTGTVKAQLGMADAGATESLLSTNEAEEVQEEVLPPASDRHVGSRLFKSTDVIDAFIGTGGYSHLTQPDSRFGLGFIRFSKSPQETAQQSPSQVSPVHPSGPTSTVPTHPIAPVSIQSHAPIQPMFGHPGVGGSTAFADASARVSIAITINKLHPKPTTVGRVVQLLCQHLGATVPPIYEAAL